MQRESRRHTALARIGIAVAAASAAAGVVACSPSPADPPTIVDFGANGGTSVGMAPMTGMSAMPMPAATSMDPPASPVAGTEVRIDNFAFVPATLTVKRGETVTWTNHDEEPHTVASGDGSFHSPGMDANGTYSFTFSTPGSFDYICSIHPFMRGTVVVTA
ncbi:cupredoxin family copper-binding protein [Mycolicibacterium sp.]|uniref:cupredoxin family copper-binding protein n=1 Tax=Mycolicibacterium sp. TaxID=2320850 RepID=UPI0037C609C0